MLPRPIGNSTGNRSDQVGRRQDADRGLSVFVHHDHPVDVVRLHQADRLLNWNVDGHGERRLTHDMAGGCRSAVVAAISDLPDDVALGNDADWRLSIVDDDEPVDVFRRHLPGRLIQGRRP